MLAFSLFGVLFMFINWWLVARDLKYYREMREELEQPINPLSKAEVKLFF